MLRWRLVLGSIFVGLLFGLFWLDARAEYPGLTYLAPLAFLIAWSASDELLDILKAASFFPGRNAVRLGVLAAVSAAFLPLLLPRDKLASLECLAIGQAIGLLIVVVSELREYRSDGKSLGNVAGGFLAIGYVGLFLGFLVQLRQHSIDGDVSRGGLLALISLIAVAKSADIGAYFTGRLIGRHKLAPLLSPGKTWEGAFGGVLLACLASLMVLGPLAKAFGFHPSYSQSWFLGGLCYGVLIAVAGIAGDLSESLLKREAGLKDSSSWLPGFGGVLDLVDSLLVSAPVAYLLWNTGVVSLQ